MARNILNTYRRLVKKAAKDSSRGSEVITLLMNKKSRALVVQAATEALKIWTHEYGPLAFVTNEFEGIFDLTGNPSVEMCRTNINLETLKATITFRRGGSPKGTEQEITVAADTYGTLILKILYQMDVVLGITPEQVLESMVQELGKCCIKLPQAYVDLIEKTTAGLTSAVGLEAK